MKLHIIKSSSLTFVWNSAQLTFKKRQITIILESLSFLENHEEEKQTTFCVIDALRKEFRFEHQYFLSVFILSVCVKKSTLNFISFEEKLNKCDLNQKQYLYEDLGKICIKNFTC